MPTYVATPCGLPTVGNVCRLVTDADPATRYFVTAQPAYQGPQGPYPAMRAAGIKTVVSIRDPGEIVFEPNPYDLTEAGQFILYGIAFINVPLPHFIPSETSPGAPQTPLTQPQFDFQAFDVARIIKSSTLPLLVHCSTGDRASAAFAVFMIEYGGYSNAGALAFATTQLVLQNADFKKFVTNYKKRTL